MQAVNGKGMSKQTLQSKEINKKQQDTLNAQAPAAAESSDGSEEESGDELGSWTDSQLAALQATSASKTVCKTETATSLTHFKFWQHP